MKVDFNFGAMAEITLTPESPKEESLIRMCYEITNSPILVRNGENKIKIQFNDWMNMSSGPVYSAKTQNLSLPDKGCVCNGVGCNSCEPQGRG